eukprot:TRINITY_DN34094_c0_g1_i1.p1 TRINITY_DN34094_c0_g1~~TRINITY_DN34094_c0_g1_i1.p1  ORF type:complete len:452 (+),score=65.99 TRINITY_DN34094_c0_g1_i1:79-1434(+)
MLLRSGLLAYLLCLSVAMERSTGCKDSVCRESNEELLEEELSEVGDAKVSLLQRSQKRQWPWEPSFGDRRRSPAIRNTKVIWPTESNSHVYLSEKNWHPKSGGAVAVNPGAYFKLKFGKSEFVDLLLEATGHDGHYMTLAYSFNNEPLRTKQISGSTASLSLAEGLDWGSDYTLRVEIYNSIQENGDRFGANPKTGLHLQGIVLDAAAVTIPLQLAKKRALFYGDSITEGVSAECGEGHWGDLNANAAPKTWVASVASAFDAEYSQVGFGYQGWIVKGAGGVPPFYTEQVESKSSWNKIFFGAPRTFDNLDYIFVLHGTNDGLSYRPESWWASSVHRAVKGFLSEVRKATGAETHIFLVVPFGSFCARNKPEGVLKRAFDDYQEQAQDNRTHFLDLGEAAAEGLDRFVTGGTTYSCDGIHPTGGSRRMPSRQQQLGAMMAVKAAEALRASG